MYARHEQQLVNAILTLLTLKRIPHFHARNTGSVIRRRDGSLTFGKSMFTQRGAPDIFAWKSLAGEIISTDHPVSLKLPHGTLRGYAIEVKSETGRVSPEQKEWLDRFTAIGGVSIVARKLEDVAGPMGIPL